MTPIERWGTCCPFDPECEHSFLDEADLRRWMDSPLSDATVAALYPSSVGNGGQAT